MHAHKKLVCMANISTVYLQIQIELVPVLSAVAWLCWWLVGELYDVSILLWQDNRAAWPAPSASRTFTSTPAQIEYVSKLLKFQSIYYIGPSLPQFPALRPFKTVFTAGFQNYARATKRKVYLDTDQEYKAISKRGQSLKFCYSLSFWATKNLLYEKFIRIQPGIQCNPQI